MRGRSVVLLAVIFSIAFIDSALAQSQFFVDPLRAAVLSPSLRDSDDAFVLGRYGIRRKGNEGDASADRHYIATERSDYASADWTFEVTFSRSADAPDDVLFIGIGEAERDDTFFNEPRNSLNFRIHQGHTAFETGWRVDVAAHDTGFLSFPYQITAGYLTGTDAASFIARIRKVGAQISFEILGTGIGVMIADINAAAPFLAQGPSRIFFGNASSAYSFTDVRVLPEDATLR